MQGLGDIAFWALDLKAWGLYVIVILNIVDAFVTIRRLNDGWIEANPVMRVFIKALGPVVGVIAPKAVVLFALWVYIREMPMVLLVFLTAFFTYWALRGFRE